MIVCALNYNTPQPKSIDAARLEPDTGEPRGWISRYAWGDDYHDVLRSKLNVLVAALTERFDEPFEARAYADTGPLQERIFAKHAGLGWLGKNTLLLNQALGSWFFLGAILTTLDLTSFARAALNRLRRILCGSCTRCIDACPTDALGRALCHGCASLHLLSDHRASRQHPGRSARADRPARLWLRHLPGRLSLEPSCAGDTGGGISAPNFPAQARRRTAPKASIAAGAIGRIAFATQSLFLPSLEWLAAMTEDEYKVPFATVPSSAPNGAAWSAMRASRWEIPSSTAARAPATESARYCNASPRLLTRLSPNLPFGRSPASNKRLKRSLEYWRASRFEARQYDAARYSGIIPASRASPPRRRSTR